ncbi:formimidoylglutamase [Zobellella aerophila]|uniref:Formimidoylglutamase n=1 Tax=Zobellella aerophila TaxID=870480 RepID=A0ABP6WJ65_9GAMM
MKAKTGYNPADMSLWQGRIDSEEGSAARRWHQQILPVSAPQAPGVVLLGLACDAGVKRNLGRSGAAGGPAALRAAAANLAWHLTDPLYDGGDVSCRDDELEIAQQLYAEQVAARLGEGHRVIGLGGGHEIAYGSFRGLVDHLGRHNDKPRIGIVNFDAHLDLRQSARASSGTPFNQCASLCEEMGIPFQYTCIGVSRNNNTRALFDRARQLDTEVVLDEQLNGWDLSPLIVALDKAAAGADYLYVTLCLDVLPGQVAPGVSAPAGRGMELSLLEYAIDRLKRSNKVLMADIAELNPDCDQHSQTARVAARLLERLAR